MQAMLLSDQPPLLQGLSDTLRSLSARITLRRADAAHDTGAADLVFVDLAWCGLARLPQLAEDLRRQRQDAALVLLLDHPEDVSQIESVQVDADLLVAKQASPQAVCRSMRRFLPAAA